MLSAISYSSSNVGKCLCVSVCVLQSNTQLEFIVSYMKTNRINVYSQIPFRMLSSHLKSYHINLVMNVLYHHLQYLILMNRFMATIWNVSDKKDIKDIDWHWDVELVLHAMEPRALLLTA